MTGRWPRRGELWSWPTYGNTQWVFLIGADDGAHDEEGAYREVRWLNEHYGQPTLLWTPETERTDGTAS